MAEYLKDLEFYNIIIIIEFCCNAYLYCDYIPKEFMKQSTTLSLANLITPLFPKWAGGLVTLLLMCLHGDNLYTIPIQLCFDVCRRAIRLSALSGDAIVWAMNEYMGVLLAYDWAVSILQSKQ